MRFEVHGQAYFLALLPGGGLGLFRPSGQGLEQIPIVHDDEPGRERVPYADEGHNLIQ